MKQMDYKKINSFIHEHIQDFHDNRLKCLSDTKLSGLLEKKNPYLFRAKNLITSQDLVISLLDARLSSSEEKIFGDFLEELARYVAKERMKAEKSTAHGLDFEYTKKGTRFLVSVKSGLNWGNSSQWKALEHDFKIARQVFSQRRDKMHIETILGVCYGRAKTTTRKSIIKQVVGQNFWYMISGDETFYVKIIEPLGHKAKELTQGFNENKVLLINKFTKEFTEKYCNKEGRILWGKIVELNSGNITKDDRVEFR